MAPMGKPTTLLLFLLLHFTIDPGAAQQVMQAHSCNEANGNYTSTSTYKSNLDALLKSISSNTNISYGFFNLSSGRSPDQVNALALCRGDLGSTDCHNCLDFVIANLTQLCPNQKEAIGWADTCMLRYSNLNVFDDWDVEPHWVLSNGSDAGNDSQFTSVLQDLTDRVKNHVGNSPLKFATQVASVNASVSIYTLMQCSLDLSDLHCLNCLYRAIAYVDPYSLHGQSYGKRVLLPGCNLRYELYKFYNSSDSLANTAQPSLNCGSGKSGTSIVVLVVAVVASLSVLINLMQDSSMVSLFELNGL